MDVERVANTERYDAFMTGKHVHTAVALLVATGLLGACGPGNTLRTKDGSDDFRLKAVESSLEKIQGELKELKGRQGRDEAAVNQLQKHFGELVAALKAKGFAPSLAAAPQGSALGVGFAHPGAAAGPEAGAEPASPPPAEAPSPAAPPSPPPAGPGHGIPMPTPGNGKIAAAPALPTAQQPPTPSPAARGRKGYGHVGPVEAPTTPEAAIAADRAGQPEKPAATPPSSPAPATPSAPAAPAETKASEAPATPPAGPSGEAAAKPAPVKTNHPGGLAETASPAEKSEYNRALQLAINGNAAGAKAAFDQFATAHPQSPLAPSALYWVGESAYAAGDYKAAVTDFDKVAKGWPGHGKAADALYKMAMAQEKTGDAAAARATLERYLKDYPEADLASVVRQKLQNMPK